MFYLVSPLKIFSTTVIFSSLFSCAVAYAEDYTTISTGDAGLVVIDGEVQAKLSDEGCSSGFEPACSAVRQRNEYLATSAHQHGDKVVYSWDVFVPEGFVYQATGGHLYAVRFLVGENDAILQFGLDEQYGYEVSRKICFAPDDFGDWHSVEVRVAWDSTKKKGLKDKTPGEMHISCDGVEVFSKAGRPNIAQGSQVRLALGLEGALELAEGDNVAVSYRN